MFVFGMRNNYRSTVRVYVYVFVFNLVLRGQLETTVGEEKQFNPRLTKDVDTFVDIMGHLNLAPPKFIGKHCVFVVVWFMCNLPSGKMINFLLNQYF